MLRIRGLLKALFCFARGGFGREFLLNEAKYRVSSYAAIKNH